MGRQIKLKDYTHGESHRTVAELQFEKFISAQKEGKILIIGPDTRLEVALAHRLGHKVTYVDVDFQAIKTIQLENPEVDARHMDFFSFAGLNDRKFEYIADLGFSDRLLVKRWHGFHGEVAKMLDGLFFTMVANSQDSYCLEHCPDRRWTVIDDVYQRYLTKEDICSVLERNYLRIIKATKVFRKSDSRRFHCVIARQTMSRL